MESPGLMSMLASEKSWFFCEKNRKISDELSMGYKAAWSTKNAAERLFPH